jgi:hypothetical protein
MSTTNSTIIHEWEDAPEDGSTAEEWPYPTRYSKSLITGELADRIRERLGQNAGKPPVFITEQVVSGGYSEYTQENDYYHTINVGSETVEIGPEWHGNGIRALTDWLDKTEEN